MNIKAILSLSPTVLIPFSILAQSYAGQNEVSASAGGFPAQEMAHRDVVNLGGSRGSEVNGSNVNLFATYRYCATPRIAIGFTAGYGAFSGESWDDGMIYNNQHFSYRYTTVATETRFTYVNKKWFRAYSLIGVGYSIYQEQVKYDYSSSAQATQNVSSGHPNGYFVPLGIGGMAGDNCMFFFNLGIGYKGMLSGGISLNFGDPKKTESGRNGARPENVMVIPRNYPVNDGFRDRGRIVVDVQPGDYSQILNAAQCRASTQYGNVIRVDKIVEPHPGRYVRLKGDVFFLSDTSRISERKNQVTKDDIRDSAAGELVVYCLDGRHRHGYKLFINGKRHNLVSTATYVFKIKQTGEYELKLDKFSKLTVNINRGEKYYVKTYLRTYKSLKRRKESRIIGIDERQGQFEAATEKKCHYVDLDTRN